VTSTQDSFITRAARPARFLIVGAVMAVIAIGMLEGLKALGVGAVLAYAISLVTTLQLNFVANQLFVWGDRASDGRRDLFDRWVGFHTYTALSLVANLVIFAGVRLVVPDLVAVGIGTLAATAFKFGTLDRMTFKDKAAL
jgi:putative flippase GtrA